MKVKENIAVIGDRGMVLSLCALVFCLPVSIALLDSFAALAVFFYFFKKIGLIIYNRPLQTPILKLLAPPANILNLPLKFLVLAVFISSLQSQYPVLSFLAFLGKFLKCLFLYFCFIEVFTTNKRMRIFLKVFLLSAFLTVLNGLIQHYTGRELLKGHLMMGGRINSFFYGANGLGAYLVPVIGLVTHFLYSAISSHKSKLFPAGLAFFLVLLMTCLCWTYSRSAWVGFLSILTFMVCIDHRKVFFSGVLLLVLFLIFLPSLGHIRHVNLINDVNPAFEDAQQGHSLSDIKSDMVHGGSGRINFWKTAVSIIRTYPVWGAGLNTYTKIIKRIPHAEMWYAHNCYLQMAAEIGLVGLACFLWVLFVLFRHGLNYCGHVVDLWPKTLLQGALSGLFGFLVQSFFDNTLFTVQLSVLLWLIIGLIVAVMRTNPYPVQSPLNSSLR